MVYYASGKRGNAKVNDLANIDYRDMDLGGYKSKMLNTTIRTAIMNGVLPGDLDIALGVEFANSLYVEMNAKNTTMFLTNIPTFGSMLRKELKPFVYWINEYIELDDPYTVINVLVNTIIERLNNTTFIDKCNVPDNVLSRLHAALNND